MIEIWQPRYKDDKCLIATYKVMAGKNKIVFTKAKHLAGMTFEVDSKDIIKCPKQTNGKIDCYVVPMSFLKRC